jgi:hypothetical protein
MINGLLSTDSKDFTIELYSHPIMLLQTGWALFLCPTGNINQRKSNIDMANLAIYFRENGHNFTYISSRPV